MSLYYGLGGATTSLAVIGACELFLDGSEERWRTDYLADMLFTGDGEAFNVRSQDLFIPPHHLIRSRSDNSSKKYHHMPGQVWV